MDNSSFLNGIVSSALTAQEQQKSYSGNSGDVSESCMSGITERDGYVGEVVKQSLALFETTSSPKDYTKKFDSKYTVLVSSMQVTVADTDMPVDFDMDPVESIADLVAYVSNASEVDLNLDALKITFGSDNKIHMEQDSEYGLVKVEVGVTAYEEVDAKSVLKL